MIREESGSGRGLSKELCHLHGRTEATHKNCQNKLFPSRHLNHGPPDYSDALSI